ncbi:MAG: hypothetical protein WC459_03510 [Patescibacteria group bacterium]
MRHTMGYIIRRKVKDGNDEFSILLAIIPDNTSDPEAANKFINESEIVSICTKKPEYDIIEFALLLADTMEKIREIDIQINLAYSKPS